jgi:Ca2+-binding RTX toxin-like protein
MKRTAILLMVTMAAAVLLAGGVALAESLTCNGFPPCYGTPEGDTITATPEADTIYAFGGNDLVSAAGGNDTVYGSSGNDELRGEGGNDTAYGGGGHDTINAEINDTLGSTDRSYSGGGNDLIFADDGNVDIINCGKGTADQVVYDQALDTVKACENKFPE